MELHKLKVSRLTFKPELHPETLEEFLELTFEQGSNLSTPCRRWRRYIDKRSGYAVARFKGKLQKVHKITFFLLQGWWPEWPALVLDHLCNVHDCINPYHLEPVPR